MPIFRKEKKKKRKASVYSKIEIFMSKYFNSTGQ